MRDINIQVQEVLNNILPTQYELFLDNSAACPCITYQIIQNSEISKGNLNGYSAITIRVKLWIVTVEDEVDYSARIDDAMATLGHFERLSVGELSDGDLLCRVLDYSILLPETYNAYRI